ncbi:hypothetical protein BsWGS_02957 [Bradybaena similaris]
MLKWTKQKRKLSRAGKNDSGMNDKTVNSTCKDSIKVEFNDKTEIGNRVSERDNECTSFSTFKSTGEDNTITKASKSQPPSEQFIGSEGVLVTDKATTPTSLTATALLSGSAGLLTDNSKADNPSTGLASQPQISTSLDSKTTTQISSFEPETPSSLTPQPSISRQPDPSTAFMASNAGSAKHSPTDDSGQPPDFSASQQDFPRSIVPILPDVARSAVTMNSDILGPEVVWDLENLTMSHVADLDTFPCVCFFEESVKERDGHREFLSPGLKIYSRQPVLLHMKTTKKQARARTIYKDPRGAYYEVGQTLIIPDDYKGWFELVPSDFSRATCYLSIEEVAKAFPKRFFTRSNLKGIRIEGEGDQQKYLERRIRAGSVLETKGPFTAKWKTRAETGLFKKKTTEWEFQEMTYLKCIDNDQQEILIPVTHKGKFSAIYERGRTRLNQNAVYSMKDILSDLDLPIKVRLLYGKAPVVPCIFTGMLVVRSSAVDDAVVGSTILNSRNVLFEVPTKAPVQVKYISKDEQFAEMTTYRDAQKLCRRYAQLFSSMIKLSPELDTDQKVIMHVPTDPSVMRQVDEALRALDLVTDISFTGEPKDHMLDSSDSGSINSDDQILMPKGGRLEDLEEFKGRESQTHV